MKADKSKKVKMQTLLSVLIIGIWILLMIGKVYADSEPGAIPLLLIVVGAGWYFITRFRIGTQHESE